MHELKIYYLNSVFRHDKRIGPKLKKLLNYGQPAEEVIFDIICWARLLQLLNYKPNEYRLFSHIETGPDLYVYTKDYIMGTRGFTYYIFINALFKSGPLDNAIFEIYDKKLIEKLTVLIYYVPIPFYRRVCNRKKIVLKKCW